ncbi:MAG: AIR carboxylase family protein, partial [Verrucomicrobia bacterium]|nr:AIR carboxylase family protein [Verrucomicrobiota bacterium]
GAAHLPGMVASLTTLPVIGVPIALSKLEGMDSLLSIVQMPAGVPVATVSIGGAKNAGLLALRILSLSDSGVRDYLSKFAKEQAELVANKKLPR